jgi:Fe-S-cluster containining protein
MGTWDQALADDRAGVKDFTKDGTCSGCGNCCSNFLPISDTEIKRIQRYVKEHDIKEYVCRYPVSKPVVDITCPFRNDGAKKCTIYPVRPAICQDFQCDKSKKNLELNKALYHGKYAPVDMRATFFGRETVFAEFMKEIL